MQKTSEPQNDTDALRPARFAQPSKLALRAELCLPNSDGIGILRLRALALVQTV
jgi:hypothetical protein